MIDDREYRLQQVVLAINIAASFLRPHVDLFDQFENQIDFVTNIDPLLAPHLFRSEERRRMEELFAPLFAAARRLVAEFDRAQEAAKAKG